MELEAYKFDNLNFRFYEHYDVIGELYYDREHRDWVVETGQDLPENLSLIDIIRKDETIGPMLDILPKVHSFQIGFQIPDWHSIDMYPLLDDDEYGVKILGELDECLNPVAPSYNVHLFEHVLEDMKDLDHVFSIVNDLDSIGSGYLGIAVYKDNCLIETLQSPCSKAFSIILDLSKQMNSDDRKHVIKHWIFELIKMQKFAIFLDIIKTRNEETEHFTMIEEQCEYVMNEAFRKVFEFITGTHNFLVSAGNDDTPTLTKNVYKISTMPESIKEWFLELDKCACSNQMAWRILVDKNIEFSDIEKAYAVIK
jgi:hypothetical protein